MAKLGVITDGISREFEHALTVMNEFDLEHAELQFVWDKEVGDHSDAQIAKITSLIKAHNVQVPCISRHIFGGLSVNDMTLDHPTYLAHLDSLRRCITMAKAVGSPLVRIMAFRKEMILFGSHGADQWNVSNGAWDNLVKLVAPAVQIAEDEAMTIVVETGNNAMITSAWLGRKLIDTLGSSRLKLMWDPCNSLYCNERTYPDGYEAIKGDNLNDTLGHIHMKDSLINIPHATVQCRALGEGDIAPYLDDLAEALREDAYDGVISLESVYRPDGGTFEDGFRASANKFKQWFG
ncbi:MAG: sugar phosphate isomerase/epimerase family protein [Chloroflexota bacterium]